MSMLSNILSNGYWPIIPIIVWNALFASKLPPAFDPKSFNSDIPIFIIIGENIFRAIIFLMPLLFRISITTLSGKVGIVIYSFGALIYFAAWLILIYAPDSSWSTSAIGFSAPAYTPLIWLVGLCLMADSYYIKMAFSKLHFILPSIGFVLFHVLHTALVYRRI